MEKTWEDAIIKVLAESDTPLHYSDITEQILSRGYYETDGATPSATVNARIASSIKHQGHKSPYLRVGKGLFTLKESLPGIAENSVNDDLVLQGANIQATLDEDLSSSIIHSFGMYWQRDLIVWRNDPKLFGKQQASSKPVDFGKQKGIYILYDHHTVVYVGRSIDRPLGKRLYEHTIDRLGSRWNRFSWFGLLEVTQKKAICKKPP